MLLCKFRCYDTILIVTSRFKKFLSHLGVLPSLAKYATALLPGPKKIEPVPLGKQDN